MVTRSERPLVGRDVAEKPRAGGFGVKGRLYLLEVAQDLRHGRGVHHSEVLIAVIEHRECTSHAFSLQFFPSLAPASVARAPSIGT